MPTPAIYMRIEQRIYRSHRNVIFVNALFIAAVVAIFLIHRYRYISVDLILVIVPVLGLVMLIRLLKGYSSNGNYLGKRNSPALRLWIAVGLDISLLLLAVIFIIAVINLVWSFIEFAGQV